MPDGTPLGALLLSEGLLTEVQLEAALAQQAVCGRQLGRILVADGVISEVELSRALARQVGLPFVDLGEQVLDPVAAVLVPEALARRSHAIPIGREGERLVVAMADPSNVFALDDLRAATGRELRAVVATESQVAACIDRVHRVDADAVVQAVAEEQRDPTAEAGPAEVVEDAPIVKFVNLLIDHALADRASDIHVEPGESDLRIRYRIDGVLHDVMRSPRSIQAGVISRLKVMADIDIAERRLPQDGRIGVSRAGRKVDLRVATLPTVHGEKVVMRILDEAQAVLDLADLGFLEEPLARFERSYRRPYGAVLVTGPTGSGKSTTLYAALNRLNEPHRNIITVEDPVEYRLTGVNQIQVHPKAGLTFARALRSILRADPDVVLVGEIRDRETATIAIEAALTGHMVLSTLHTNDAASTPVRLVEMGVEPFLVTSALDCVVAQRLVRRICDRCREPYHPAEAELAPAGWYEAGAEVETSPTLFRPVGCEACSGTGYRGRFALHEVLTMTEEVERLVVDRRPSEEIAALAREQGMVPLRTDGLRKAALGRTSLEEILRVVA